MEKSSEDISVAGAARASRGQPGSPRLALLGGIALAACWAHASTVATLYVGAVYAATNSATGNAIAAFGSHGDGTVTPIAEFATGGLGGAFDAGEGLDPLISADSVLNVDDRFLLAANAGSNTVSSFRINRDVSLTLVSTAPTGGAGTEMAGRLGLAAF